MQIYSIKDSFRKLIVEEVSKNFVDSLANKLLEIVNDYDTKNKSIKNTIVDRIEALTLNETEISEIDILNAIIDTVNYLTKKTDTNKNEKEVLSGDITDLSNSLDNISPEMSVDINPEITIDGDFKIINDIIKENKIEVNKILLTESTTWYDLRYLLSTIYKYVSNSTLKSYILELTKAIGKIELSGVPLAARPQIAKLKAISPNLF